MDKIREWQEEALAIECEGHEVSVIGRLGRLQDERARAGAAGPNVLTFKVELPDAPPEVLTKIADGVQSLVKAAVAEVAGHAAERTLRDDTEEGKKAAGGDLLVDKSKVRELIKKCQMDASGEAVEALSKAVEELVKRACKKASDHSRQTVSAADVSLPPE